MNKFYFLFLCYFVFLIKHMFDEDFETDAYKDCATNSLYVEFDAFAKRHAKHTTY